MRRLALTLAPLLLLACNQEAIAPASGPTPSFSAASDGQEFSITVDWVSYNPCLDEDLHGSGTSFISRNVVTTNEEIRVVDHVRGGEDWQMLGLTTGHIWKPVPGAHNSVVFTESGSFITVEERFTFRNQTTGVVLVWPSKITYVTNANGEVKVDRVQFDDCMLIH